MSHLIAIAFGAPVVAATTWVGIVLYLNMVLPEDQDGRARALFDMGRIGFAIILAAIAAYAADRCWNDGRYTDNTVSVLRHAQHALGWGDSKSRGLLPPHPYLWRAVCKLVRLTCWLAGNWGKVHSLESRGRSLQEGRAPLPRDLFFLGMQEGRINGKAIGREIIADAARIIGMGEDSVKCRALAEECGGRAENARNCADRLAWLALAEEWLMLARDATDDAFDQPQQ